MQATLFRTRRNKIVLIFALACLIFLIGARVHAQTSPVTIKIMVVRINFPTSTYQPLTTAQLQEDYFDTSNPNSIASYYLANSGGRILLTGTVVGPYTINPSGVGVLGTCEIENWESQAETPMRADGIDPSQYKYFQLLTPSYSGCPSATGLSDYGVPDVYPSTAKLVSVLFQYYYYNGIFAPGLAAHEIGHLLGTSHTAYGTDDYGDHSSVMGNMWYISGYAALGFVAPHLINDGWTNPGEVQTVTQSGTYTVNSLESGTGLRILEIPKPDTSQMYYLSTRQAVGIDANMPAAYLGGAELHMWNAPGNSNFRLSAQIVPPPGDPNMAMTDNSTYTDSVNNITIKQLSHTASTATLSITLPSGSASACAASAPTLSITPLTASGAPGSGTTYTVTLTDNDTSSCASSQFNLSNTSVLPSNVTATLSAASLTLAPGASATAQLPVSTGAATVPGSYALQLTAKHASASAAEVSVSAFYNVISTCTANPPIFSVSPISYTDALPGVAKQYTLSITNRDTSACTSSTFTVTPQKPSGWTSSATPSSSSITLAPGAAGTIVENIISPSTATPGTTNIPMQLSDAASSVHAASVSVQYTIPAPVCTVAPPTISSSPTSYSDGLPGLAKSYTLTITNKDSAGCTSSTFTINSQQPAGWGSTASPLAGTITLAPGAAGTITESVTPPMNVAPGTTNVTMQVSDAANSAHTASVPVQYTIVCTTNPPTLSASPIFYTDGLAGVTKPYTLAITNNDTAGCTPSTFSVATQKPSGWTSSATPSSGSITLAPGAAANVVENVTSPSTATTGTSTITMQVSDPATSVHTTSVPVQYGIPAPVCTSNPPTLSASPIFTSGLPGVAKQYTLNITNNDLSGCASSTFSVNAQKPSGWTSSATPSSGSITLAPGAAGNIVESVISSSTAAPGTTTITMLLNDAANTAHTASAPVQYTVISPCTSNPPTLSITPSTASGAPGSGTTYTVTLTNNDSSTCTPSQFNLGNTSALPSSVTAALSTASLTLPAGVSATAQLTASTSAAVAPGSYALRVTAKHATASAAETEASAFYTVVSSCASNPPSLSASPTFVSGLPGLTKQYTLSITNNDSSLCGSSTFRVNAQEPTGWTSSATPSSGITLAPGAAGSVVENVTSSFIVTSGTTTISMQVSDAANGAHNTNVPVQYVIPPSRVVPVNWMNDPFLFAAFSGYTTSVPVVQPTTPPAPICTANQPSVSVSPTSYSDGFAGVAKQYTLSITNKDTSGCPSSTFSVNAQKPSGWTSSATPSTGSIILAPGAAGTVVESVTAPSTASAGTTTITMQVSDAANSAHNTSVSVQYGIPACVRAAPTLSFSPPSQTSSAGTQVSYTVQVANRDSSGCNPSTFTLSDVLPGAGWTGSFAAPGTLTVSPGLTGLINFLVTSPASAANNNTYIVSARAMDASVQVHTASNTATYTVAVVQSALPPQSSLSISASPVQSGGSSTLTWYVSSGLTTGVSCTVQPALVIKSGSFFVKGSATLTSWGSAASPKSAQTWPLTRSITVILSCTNGSGASVSKSATVQVVPTYQNI